MKQRLPRSLGLSGVRDDKPKLFEDVCDSRAPGRSTDPPDEKMTVEALPARLADTVAELEEIDMVYLERVTPGLFNMVLIYKKLHDTNPKIGECWERVSNIDATYLENVREVLQKSAIPQYEGTTQLHWVNILRDYIRHYDDITADGGWETLFGDGEDSEDEECEIKM